MQDGLRHLFGHAEAAEGHLFPQQIQGFLAELLNHIRVNNAGGDAVYPDPAGGEFRGKRAGQPDNGVLGSGLRD